ncbi:MAG: thiamine pyrophosphate-binding protein [Actinomycetota bacterium]|nr:thiamine pyrophosphate-dependent enzyme [Acidimicrobiales bacterium]MEC7873010.1 thiamine pyrophosphate-binding protein [Actinomycetota bacterium]MEC8829384.1 thiamine pyrophosphate-binding protein [Actinomycetota bacterium]MEC8976775.1 thiamine pyrophosphate-binding protein [Actinomycetota bacterium]MEC9271147.1 thiamine pyrophosphate-binding protein [Actinomycetota bacterium]
MTIGCERSWGSVSAVTHGGKLAAKALKAAGVECVFTLSGGHVMGIYDGCLDENIEVVDVRHEQAAVHAADAWARLHPGKVGVAILTAGPGVTDGVTGVANAWRANSPILVIGGQGPFRHTRRGSLQEMDHVSLMRPVSKWADSCYQTPRIAEYIESAIRSALSGIPGPAFLEIPTDVLHGKIDLAEVTIPEFRDYRVASAAPGHLISEAIDLVNRAERPMVMAGTSLKWSEGGDQLAAFLDTTGIPCFVNGMARGEISWDHPSFLSLTRKEALENADLVILAGTPLDFRMKFGRSIPSGASIVQMDLEQTLIGDNRGVDIGLVGNLGLNFESMSADIKERGVAIDVFAYRDQLRQRETELDAERRSRMDSDETPIDPLRLCRDIANAVTDDMIVIGDGGDIVAQASKVINVPREGTWMDPGPLGTLGVGMPFALAAQKAYPDKRVLIVYGDGSFGLNGFEYDTAVRFDLPIVGVVGNDAAWGQMMRPQGMLYGKDRLVAVELNRTRYDKVVEALGGHGEHVTEAEEIAPAIARAFASGKPALVNVEIRQDRGEMKGSTYV